MAEIYELNIMTNDGWVVTLIGDKPIDLGDVVLTSIIVQPKEEHDARVPVGGEPGVTRTEYRLRMMRHAKLDEENQRLSEQFQRNFGAEIL